MILGVLGKGGSGKSTLSTMLTHELLAAGKRVLAIDADHNMDLAYNLGATIAPPYLGDALDAFLAHIGHMGHYSDIFTQAHPPRTIPFTFDEPFTRDHAQRITDQLLVMLTGPQSERVLHGEACSHSLATVLKAYLPLLELDTDHAIVVDEKASVDAVSTGIPTGFDLAVIAVEPRDPSIRAAQHIARALEFYDVPYVFVGNKVRDEQEAAALNKQLGTPCVATVAFATTPTMEKSSGLLENITKQLQASPARRLERTRRKFVQGKEFSEGQ
ncbi:MAG: AAA family ATPase [Candidatus Pacebacteria bacterium]|nr:AAA family ATPase [Candidatus Paceibacterota bacterium]